MVVISKLITSTHITHDTDLNLTPLSCRDISKTSPADNIMDIISSIAGTMVDSLQNGVTVSGLHTCMQILPTPGDTVVHRQAHNNCFCIHQHDHSALVPLLTDQFTEEARVTDQFQEEVGDDSQFTEEARVADQFPEEARVTDQFPEEVRSASQIPEEARAADQFPEEARDAGQFPEEARATGQFPDVPRTADHFPDVARADGQSPYVARPAGQFPG